MNVTFNSVLLNTLRTDLGTIRVVGASLPTAPSMTNYLKGSGKGTGLYDFGRKFDAKTINLTFAITSTTFTNLQALMDELTKTLLTPTTVQKLSFGHIANRYYYARVTRINAPVQEQLVAKMDVEFVAPLPYMVTDEKTTTLSADAGTITLAGSVPTKPIITATFTVASTSYRVNIGSKYVLINNSFAIGDVLVIDTATGMIKKNGVDIQSKLDWSNSTTFDDFYLSLGSNSLSVTPTAKATTVFKYRERY